jgi:hypothetical protein
MKYLNLLIAFALGILFASWLFTKTEFTLKDDSKNNQKTIELRDSIKFAYTDTVDATSGSYDPRTNTFSVDFKDTHSEILVWKNIVIPAGNDYHSIGYKIFNTKIIIGLDTSKDPIMYKFVKFEK